MKPVDFLLRVFDVFHKALGVAVEVISDLKKLYPGTVPVLPSSENVARQLVSTAGERFGFVLVA